MRGRSKIFEGEVRVKEEENETLRGVVRAREKSEQIERL